MRKIITMFTILLFSSLFIGVLLSDARDGAAVFETKCGRCHGSGGEATGFSPVKYAASQWQRFFDRNKHARKKDISAEISSADMEAVKLYLMAHAADSDLPIAAGLR